MTSGLVALLCLFLVGGVLATRIMYMFMYIEGALLTSILFMYATNSLDGPWWFLMLLIMAAISASIALSMVVKSSRIEGSDHVKSNY